MRLATLCLCLMLSACSTRVPHETAEAYQPNTANPEGEELYAVFITMSGCSWSNVKGFDQTVEHAKLLLSDLAASEQIGYAIRGVALDWDPRVGMEYLLDRFGEFDELAAGRNWFSDDAAEYIWQAEGGVPATPQFLVFRRTLSSTAVGREFSPDVLVARLVGPEEISQFVASGGALSAD